MYKKTFLMAAVLFGFLCSNAWAVEQGGIRMTQEQGVSNAYQCNVSGEIYALRQAKQQLDMERSFNPDGAYEKYYARMNEIFTNLEKRRRAEYASVRILVERECYAHARDKKRPGGGHYYDEGDVWVHHMDTNRFEVIPGSGGWKELASNRRNGGGAEIRNPRMTNGTENFAVTMWVKGPDYGHSDCYIKINLYARCRYKASIVEQMARADMDILKSRVKTGAGVN